MSRRLPTPRRSTDDNPLVAIFMLGLMVAVAGAGIWYAIREKPHVTGHPVGDGADHSEGVVGRPGPAPHGSPRFVEAFKRLPADAVALQKAADAEYDEAVRRLGVEEYARVERILARKGNSRDAYSDADLAILRGHGFGKWLRAQAIRWSHDDPAFKMTSEVVWSRSPKARGDGALAELAARWGEMNRVNRLHVYEIIQVVENKSRELSDGERETLVAFAGEDYYANRP